MTSPARHHTDGALADEAHQAYIELRYRIDSPPERDRHTERVLLWLERVVYFIGWVGAVATVLVLAYVWVLLLLSTAR